MRTVTVQLVKKTHTDVDPFGKPIETEELVDIPGCIVGKPSETEYANMMALYGKMINYVIGVPKTDTNDWIDSEVIIWGDRYQTVGYPETGIQENIPLQWGKNVKVTRRG